MSGNDGAGNEADHHDEGGDRHPGRGAGTGASGRRLAHGVTLRPDPCAGLARACADARNAGAKAHGRLHRWQAAVRAVRVLNSDHSAV